MNLCLSMWSLQEEIEAGCMDLDSFISYCCSNDVKNVELLDFFIHLRMKDLKKKLDNSGIYADAWSIANDFAHANSEIRQQQIDYVKRGIDAAAEIGAKVVRIFSGDIKDGVSYESGREWIIEALLKCELYAHQTGIIMALENHGVFAGKSEQVLDILKAVDYSFPS